MILEAKLIFGAAFMVAVAFAWATWKDRRAERGTIGRHKRK